MNNNKTKLQVFFFSLCWLRSDPADNPSEEDDDEPQYEESFGFRWSKMIWSLIAELGSADTSSPCKQRKIERNFDINFI